jgi:hypothetical protein
LGGRASQRTSRDGRHTTNNHTNRDILIRFPLASKFCSSTNPQLHQPPVPLPQVRRSRPSQLPAGSRIVKLPAPGPAVPSKFSEVAAAPRQPAFPGHQVARRPVKFVTAQLPPSGPPLRFAPPARSMLIGAPQLVDLGRPTAVKTFTRNSNRWVEPRKGWQASTLR